MATTGLGYPYPVGTDRLMDGDDAIKALAEKINAFLGVIASGMGTIVNLPQTTPTAITITLPVGRFPVGVSPTFALMSYGGTTAAYASTSYSVSAYTSGTSFQAIAYRNAGGTANQNFCWTAFYRPEP